MNYRHAYHAGNFADVLKHIVLVLVIEHLKRKATPFRVVDTHAGAGAYDLSSTQAEKTGEWRLGIGLLTGLAPPAEVAEILGPYLDCVGAIDARGETLASYPGSPLIAARLLRPDDQLLANELHPEDRAKLRLTLREFENAKVLGLDGYVALKSTLPPKERRGAVLVDPPFEEPGELQRLAAGLKQAIARFGHGIFLLWYPIKDPRPIAAFKHSLKEVGAGKLLTLEWLVNGADDPARLNGCGLVIVNPPFRMEGQMRILMPWLVEHLSHGPGARFELTWLSSET